MIKIRKRKARAAVFQLRLEDGSLWQFSGINNGGVRLVFYLARVMNMNEEKLNNIPIRSSKKIHHVMAKVSKKISYWRNLPLEKDGKIECCVGRIDTLDKLVLQLMRVSHVVVHAAERNGGLLVHGALAERKGIGVILSGPSGVGKSTASKRLLHPWRSLSDDTTLIVKAPNGQYWAHPWPTWSRCREGDEKTSWRAGSPVKLGLICMLTQGEKDRLYPLPSLQTIHELVEVSGQAFVSVANGLNKETYRRINLARFHNAVAISKNIPIRRLQISRKGEFWKEIEKFLGDPERTCRKNEN